MGHADFITNAEELIVRTGTRGAEQQLLVTYADPELLGFAWSTLPLADNVDTLEAAIRFTPGVDPGPLLDALRALRPVVAVRHPAGLDLSAHGFTLAQAEVAGALRLPVTVPAPGNHPDYVFHSWRGPVPEAHQSGLAGLKETMSTDMPWGGQAHEREAWDAQRIREAGDAARRAGRETLWTVAVHEASGDYAGYTQLSCPTSRPDLAFQEDTLVVGAHRGHGLGMALKSANLLQLGREMPQVRTVYTWNAEDNRHMLDINRRLGVTPSGIFECWQAG
ncbi:GNAT family N-acetyltransferase [Corynebacterium comes]|uniref:GNAT family N-acetyltransferase n=1 Tax=Corynebacterium comes TaxID=2675218 RepID=A0A6B8VYS1_9CORY|nr:hypothetical protein [Corynebacterium comes]QGU04205.1 hypothetical protein CETAM_04670 [Corynebacterium comes]